MENQYMDMNTLKFLLYDVHNTEELFSAERFSAYDKDSIDLLLDSVKVLSDKELFPYVKEMDEKPAYFDNGKIIIHPQAETFFKQAVEMGLVGAPYDEAEGGLQLPTTIFNSAFFIMEAANNHIPGYLLLTMGAANLIINFGSQKLKDTYVPKMLSMEWGGTMCLTEPQAGSSLSDITTSATPTSGDYHLIKGQKIFISAGDHQFSDNFVHLVLARVDGAVAGTKGISLFVVPNKRPTETGSFEDNQVQVAGEFEKLGQRNYCTTHLVFGENDDCRGWLVGAENKGLSYMFLLMNEARIATGRMGTGIATAAYYSSLQYANERPQGRKLNASGGKNAEQEQTLIINHPDVKRMLFTQKALVEGSLSLVLQASYYLDKEETLGGKEKERYNLLLELLTPIVKTFPAEKGQVAINNGLQILGGYGFCMDFMLQQYYRDIRIIALYEGTTGIQSLDLLGRKITMKEGKVLEWLADEIKATIGTAAQHENLQSYANILAENLGLVQKVLGKLMPHAMKGDFECYLADATVFMDFFGTIVVGWQWLKMANAAQGFLNNKEGSQADTFYESKIHTMKFYFNYEMNKTKGLAKTLMSDETLTINVEKEMF